MASGFTERTRVFLADDHVVLLQGLRAILEKEGIEVVGEAADGQAAVRMCARLQPDVVVLDIGMPSLNGIDAAREILQSRQAAKVVLLTMHSDESYVLASLRAGITGYVLKSNAAWSLLEAIRTVTKGEIYLSPGVSRTLAKGYLSHTAVPADPLSGREREVLRLIAEGKNTKEIGGVLCISAKTAETHRRRIMQKLNISSVAGLVRYALRRGLIVEPGMGGAAGVMLGARL